MSGSIQNKGVVMKKITVGLAVVFGLSLLQPAHAEVPASIVIIDTAVDSTATQIKNNLIYEVCILESYKCPNGQFTQEGPGAATLPVTQVYSGGFEHGSIMASIATQVNPSVKIIFIRLAGVTSKGAMGSMSDTQVKKSLDWVIANKAKFNIVSVSSSLGTHALKTGVNYCPIKATDAGLISNIDTLIKLGVPSIFATGNGSDSARVDFPACIPQAVAVSAVNEDLGEGYRIATWANSGPTVDFYSLGVFNTSIKRAVGTSGSAVAFSSYWAKNYKGTYQSTYDYMNSISKPTENTKLKATTFIDVLK
jgi:hypothetical protein